jgi:hypothetical protein
VLALALAARVAVMAVWSDHLSEDRDRYLALAAGLAEGRGYVIPDSDIPTAFRPPLYPVALVPAAFLPSGFWVGTLHVVLGVATVWLTWCLAQRLTVSMRPAVEGSTVALLASLFVAVDPLLLRYSTFPMTETLATFLVAGLLVAITPESTAPTSTHRKLRSISVGVLFGLAALCRPGIWAFTGLMALWRLLRWTLSRQATAEPGIDPSGDGSTCARLNLWITLVAATAVLLPWIARNAWVMRHPIVMTTHGGYTLLLGNNPAFDREVVSQKWGTVWDGTHGEGQSTWADQINKMMDAEGLTSEISRDRWMSKRARDNILADPAAFGRACWLRLRRFWGIVPVEGADDQPRWLRWSVGGFYLLIFSGGLAGLAIVCRRCPADWVPPLLMLAAFMSVHLVYWTNTRMRAPVVPIISVLSAVGWSRLVRLR